MKTRLLACELVAVAALGVFPWACNLHAQDKAAVAKPGSAQNDAQPKRACIGCSVDGKTTPRTPDGHPDFNGFWNNPTGKVGYVPRGPDGSFVFLYDLEGRPLDGDGKTLASSPIASYGTPDFLSLSEPSYKPEYAAKVKAIVDSQYGATTPEDPQFDCKPLGVPRGSFGTMQILQTPQVIGILYEASPGPVYRIIYMDGRPHPKDLDTTYMGHSIGHWDGDALVVDVAGLNDETWLGGGQAGPKYALMHSDQEHVIERWTRTGDMLNYEATVEDPVVLTKPWVITPRRIMHAGPDDEILDEICVANDKSHLTKPPEEDGANPGEDQAK